MSGTGDPWSSFTSGGLRFWDTTYSLNGRLFEGLSLALPVLLQLVAWEQQLLEEEEEAGGGCPACLVVALYRLEEILRPLVYGLIPEVLVTLLNMIT